MTCPCLCLLITNVFGRCLRVLGVHKYINALDLLVAETIWGHRFEQLTSIILLPNEKGVFIEIATLCVHSVIT